MRFYSFFLKHSYKNASQFHQSRVLNRQVQSIIRENYFFLMELDLCGRVLKVLDFRKPPASAEVFKQRLLEAGQVCAMLKLIAYVSDSTIWEHRCWILECHNYFERRDKLSYSYYHAPTTGIKKRQSFCVSLPAYVFLVLEMKFLDHVQHWDWDSLCTFKQ